MRKRTLSIVIVAAVCAVLCAGTAAYAAWVNKTLSRQNTIQIGQTTETVILGDAQNPTAELYPGVSVGVEYTVELKHCTKVVKVSASVDQPSDFDIVVTNKSTGEPFAENVVADGDIVVVTVTMKASVTQKPVYTHILLTVTLEEQA